MTETDEQTTSPTIKNWVVLIGAIGIFYTTIKGTVDLYLSGEQKRRTEQFAATDKVVDYVFEMSKSNTIQINSLTARVTTVTKDLSDTKEELRKEKSDRSDCQKKLESCNTIKTKIGK